MNNRFIYPLRISLEQILLNADDQDALNEDCNDHSECETNKSITNLCRSSYKKNENYSINLTLWNRVEHLVLYIKLLIQTVMRQENQISNKLFIYSNYY